MSENETAVAEPEVAAETKAPKKAKPVAKKASGKKPVSKMTEKASKKTATERKALANKAAPKSSKPKKETLNTRKVEVEVGGKKVQWPRKKAGVLLALRTLKKESTKIEIAAELEKMGMNNGNINSFCWEMNEEKLVDMVDYQGDHNWYRSITEKGKKVVLPKLYI